MTRQLRSLSILLLLAVPTSIAFYVLWTVSSYLPS